MRVLASMVVLLGVLTARAEDEKRVVPNRNWVGVVNNEKLKAEGPKGVLITDQKTFAKAWKAWRPDEKVPDVDFKKELVVVTYAGGPNRPGIAATVKDGTLRIMARQTLIGGDGFGYSLATFDRKGITHVGTEKVP